jgi:NAD(P)H-dependent flavin oxidoreductase YrpB (nitropropane dioxygenase family)
VTGGRRFSDAIAEGDGISLVAEVDGPDAARAAESAGAEGVFVPGAAGLAAIREAVSVPVLVPWEAARTAELDSCDAVVVDSAGGDVRHDAQPELALRVKEEEQLEEALERIDPELLVLTGSLEQVLDLLPDVPAGKLVIAQLPTPTNEDIEELERAGVDAVIVHGRDLR